MPNTKSLTREFRFDCRDIDADERILRGVSVSSDVPYQRYFGTEILSHKPGNVRLARIEQGAAPLLFAHDHKQPIGKIFNPRLEGGKLRVDMKFSRNAKATEVWQDIQDGILGEMSIGYQVIREIVDEKAGTYTAIDWEIFESSVAPVPADFSVGVGRSAEFSTNITMNETETPAGNRMTQTQRAEHAEKIRGHASVLHRNSPSCLPFNAVDEAERFILEGRTYNEFQAHCRDNFGARPVALDCDSMALTPAQERAMFDPSMRGSQTLGMGGRDITNYSFVRAIRGAAGGRLDGLEREMSDEWARRSGRPATGFYIPPDVLMAKRTLVAGSAPAGGFLVGGGIMAGSFIDILRNRMFVRALGASVLSGLTGDVPIPKKTATSSAYWNAEEEDSTESDPAFGQLNMVLHTVTGRTHLSKELVAQASMDVENLVRSDLADTLAVEQDRAAINGSGVSGEPLGLLNTTGINTVTFSTTATWAKVVSFKTEIANDNADQGSLGWLTTPTVRGKWETILKDSVAGAGYLWEPGDDQFDRVNGRKAAATKQVPDNRVIFGNWADLLIGFWGGIDLVVDPYTLAEKRVVRIFIHQFTDVAVRRPESFCASTDSGSQ